MERAKRIELSSQPWQGRVLPLNHARKNCFDYLFIIANLVRAHKFYFWAVVVAGAYPRAAGPKSCGAMVFR